MSLSEAVKKLNKRLTDSNCLNQEYHEDFKKELRELRDYIQEDGARLDRIERKLKKQSKIESSGKANKTNTIKLTEKDKNRLANELADESQRNGESEDDSYYNKKANSTKEDVE